jgi:hypothetical protein
MRIWFPNNIDVSWEKQGCFIDKERRRYLYKVLSSTIYDIKCEQKRNGRIWLILFHHWCQLILHLSVDIFNQRKLIAIYHCLYDYISHSRYRLPGHAKTTHTNLFFVHRKIHITRVVLLFIRPFAIKISLTNINLPIPLLDYLQMFNDKVKKEYRSALSSFVWHLQIFLPFVNLQYSGYKCGQEPAWFRLCNASGWLLAPEFGEIMIYVWHSLCRLKSAPWSIFYGYKSFRMSQCLETSMPFMDKALFGFGPSKN